MSRRRQMYKDAPIVLCNYAFPSFVGQSAKQLSAKKLHKDVHSDSSTLYASSRCTSRHYLIPWFLSSKRRRRTDLTYCCNYLTLSRTETETKVHSWGERFFDFAINYPYLIFCLASTNFLIRVHT